MPKPKKDKPFTSAVWIGKDGTTKEARVKKHIKIKPSGWHEFMTFPTLSQLKGKPT